jgi:hypothetical protein
LAGGLGFEPRLAESESAVLPLDDPPTGYRRATYHTFSGLCRLRIWFRRDIVSRMRRVSPTRVQNPGVSGGTDGQKYTDSSIAEVPYVGSQKAIMPPTVCFSVIRARPDRSVIVPAQSACPNNMPSGSDGLTISDFRFVTESDALSLEFGPQQCRFGRLGVRYRMLFGRSP